MNDTLKKNIKNSFYDGIFGNIFATLTGGLFLTSLALYLKMSDLLIGILAAMPYLVNISQLYTSQVIEKRVSRKRIYFWASAGNRALWIPLALIFLLPFGYERAKIYIVLFFILSSYVFASIGSVSWLSWMSDLVPDGIRGRFFGTRNTLNGFIGMIILLIFGNIFDFFEKSEDHGLSFGFLLAFSTAVILGLFSLFFIKRVKDVGAAVSPRRNQFWENLISPLKQKNFRNYLIFIFCWRFSVLFASPFFTVYLLRELKFSYSFVAALAITSAVSDLAGMQLWGFISDRVRNKIVIKILGSVVVFLPVSWIMVDKESVVLPIALHIIGGVSWAGINLCLNNMLLGISPKENKAFFISQYNVIGGLGAVLSPITAGFLIVLMGNKYLWLIPLSLIPLHIVFVLSTLLRFLSMRLLNRVSEPEEVGVRKLIRVIMNYRSINVSGGFYSLMHPFVEVSTGKENKNKS
ncbi:MAG: MFS transporter [Deltaproteobacteria bacterium]|uniref:MFS transporter n=1 Tax=Candidatus Zymogenus saltonus TaxID=2844893 RepID=A0A9D8PPD6_9DELT|nr:MFS transporter [Candidatus Zymogenus saltonus]